MDTKYGDNVYNNSIDKGVAEVIASNTVFHVSYMMNGIAESMTTAMRLITNYPPFGSLPNASNVDQNITGKAFRTEPVIQVTWLWFIFPVVVEACGVTFVLLTIYLSSRHKAKLWKSGAMPLIFHGLGDESLDDIGDLKEIHEMLVKGDSIRVHLDLGHVDDRARLLRE